MKRPEAERRRWGKVCLLWVSQVSPGGALAVAGEQSEFALRPANWEPNLVMQWIGCCSAIFPGRPDKEVARAHSLSLLVRRLLHLEAARRCERFGVLWVRTEDPPVLS
jgi:hypothetical protein